MEATRKKRKKWPWIVLAVVAVIVAAVIVLISIAAGRADTVAYISYTAARGDVETTITGSGKLASGDSVTVEIPTGVTADKVYVSAGDAVKSGDELALLNAASLSYRAAVLSEELSVLDRQLSGDAEQEYIYAPVSGRIKYLPVSEDSDVLTDINEYGQLAIISTDGLMQVSLETSAEPALNSTVTVEWEDGSADGVVAARTANGCLVTLTDNGTPYQAAVSVYDGGALLGSGTTDIHAPVLVYGTGGTIEKINFKENDKVTTSSKLFTLADGFFTDSYVQAISDRKDKADELQTVLLLIADPVVTAPQNGIISEVYLTEEGTGSVTAGTYRSYELASAGSTVMERATGSIELASGSDLATGSDSRGGAQISETPPAGLQTQAVNYGSYSGTVSAEATQTVDTSADAATPAFDINTGGAVIMDIEVDELDIASVALGQQADITLDAFASETFEAAVTHISSLGTASGSITTYSVEVTLSGDDRLLVGMNGSAVIKSQSVTDVLVIPVAAINEDAGGSYVYLSSDGGVTKTRADITTGLSDGTNVQVTAGLSEGDVICYVSPTAQSAMMSMGFGNMGGMGGMANRGGMGEARDDMGGRNGAPPSGE